jgi:hypothetical protein
MGWSWSHIAIRLELKPVGFIMVGWRGVMVGYGWRYVCHDGYGHCWSWAGGWWNRRWFSSRES